jgi:hypothetical protein
VLIRLWMIVVTLESLLFIGSPIQLLAPPPDACVPME